jgi:ubiquinone/menaquinone biosynthesis C-methylase UbiE
MENQKDIWNKIAPEWHELKKNPSVNAQEFLSKQTGRVLDAGSGSGRNILGLKTEAELYLSDFSPKMIELAKKRAKKEKIEAEFSIAPLSKLPYEDKFFDAAICVAALHCIHSQIERKNSLKELSRVLKSGAKLEIEVWNKDSSRFKNKNKKDIVKWRDLGTREYYFYTEEELKKQLEEAGFKIIKQLPHKANIIFIAEKL